MCVCMYVMLSVKSNVEILSVLETIDVFKSVQFQLGYSSLNLIFYSVEDKKHSFLQYVCMYMCIFNISNTD